MLWVKRLGTGSSGTSGGGGITPEPILVKGRDENEGLGHDCSFYVGWETDDNTIDFDFEDQSGPNHPTTGTDTALSNNVWYHIAIVHNYTHSCIYINGILDICNNVNATPATNDADIGIGTGLNSGGTADGGFNGLIDEVRILNITFTSAQITQDYMTNLYKYNQTQWYLYTNQSKNSTKKLGDGTYTYLAPDIAYHNDKYKRGFNWLINLWGPDHHGYINRLKAAVMWE